MESTKKIAALFQLLTLDAMSPALRDLSSHDLREFMSQDAADAFCEGLRRRLGPDKALLVAQEAEIAGAWKSYHGNLQRGPVSAYSSSSVTTLRFNPGNRFSKETVSYRTSAVSGAGLVSGSDRVSQEGGYMVECANTLLMISDEGFVEDWCFEVSNRELVLKHGSSESRYSR